MCLILLAATGRLRTRVQGAYGRGHPTDRRVIHAGYSAHTWARISRDDAGWPKGKPRHR